MGNERVNPGETISLALEISLLRDLLARFASGWAELPTRLEAVYLYLKDKNNSSPLGKSGIGSVKDQLEPFAKAALRGKFDFPDLLRLISILQPIICLSKEDPDYRAKGSLYSQLHGRLENIVNFLGQAPSDIARRSALCLAKIQSGTVDFPQDFAPLLGNLKKAGETCDVKQLILFCPELESLGNFLPAQEAIIRPTSAGKRTGTSSRRWHILCVEDDPVWQQGVRNAVELVKAKLSSGYHIRFEIIPDRQSAQERLSQLGSRSFGKTTEEDENFRPVIILDMGIPSDPSDLEAPSRDEGIALLKYARSAAVNLPVIVLTTPPNFLGDHLLSASLGVSDYLLKGTDSVERLIEVLIKLITQKPRRKTKILEETGRLISIDNVEVALEPQVFKTFSVLVEQSPYPVTANQAVSLLEEKYGGYLQASNYGDDVFASNVNRNWIEANRQAVTPEEAVLWFQRNFFVLWKQLKPELANKGISPEDLSTAADFIARHYGAGNANRGDFDPANIEKHVYEARLAIKKAFNAVEQSIAPEEEILVNTVKDDEFAYKVIAEVMFDGEEESLSERARSFRILIAENDVTGWQIPVVNLLRRFGYEVEAASSVEQAIVRAGVFRPDVLCLDMHLPEDDDSFQSNPLEGVADGGIRILSAVSQFLPQIRALFLTDLTDNDSLRIRAADLGVRVIDFVSKLSSAEFPWDSRLIFQIHRIEQEISREAVLPLPNVPRLPYIRLHRKRKDQRFVEVFDSPWKLSNNQFKLLWLLAENANRPVPTGVLLEEIYGDPLASESLKQLVKNFRKEIQRQCEQWFGLQNEMRLKEIAQSILANDAKVGYILNARVVFDD